MPFVRSKVDPSEEIGFGWKPNRNQTSPSRIALPLPRRAPRRGAQCSGERIVQSARLPLLPRSAEGKSRITKTPVSIANSIFLILRAR